MTHHEQLERLLEGLTPAGPPEELEHETLARAAAALERAPSPPLDPRRSLWINRPLRLAWIAAVALLLAGHLAVSLWQHQSMPAGQSLLETRKTQRELVGDLPQIAMRRITWEPRTTAPGMSAGLTPGSVQGKERKP
jgi:hypothetical protein